MRLTLRLATTATLALSAGAAFAQDQSERFELGEIVVIGARPDALSSVGGSVVTNTEMRTFDRLTLEQAVNLAPGVVSNLDSNGRRNEYDIFVRGFGRWQVPLMIDGVRIYLPADNRIDFGRFLTADIAAVQIQKGYASVLDGPGAMGGAINLVTGKPTEAFELEGGLTAQGRGGVEGWNGYVLAGTRQDRYYLRGSVTYFERDSWSLSDDYEPVPGSLEDGGKRLGSDTQDWRLNLKAGFTPNDTDEYTFNLIRQQGEKGAPLNVYTNPPVPPNSYWRWPYWDVQNASFLTSTALNDTLRLKTKLYYNTFKNGLDAHDDITYSSQSNPGRFHSPYDDEALGASIELGKELAASSLKVALHYRTDDHAEAQISRPTNPTFRTEEPWQEQSQNTWSVAVENTFHANESLDVVVGASYDDYEITKAEEFNAGAGIFEYPKGGADAFNWQVAAIWRYRDGAQLHVSLSDRARFPTIFELYSTRFGTATPNPNLGAERATNFEVGWETTTAAGVRAAGALFYSDVRDLIQTVVLPDTTTQTQNVGDGRFYGLEASLDAPLSARFSAGGNYTFLRRTIEDALRPDLRPTGVPTHKIVLYAAWRPSDRVTVSPSLEAADDRWSDVNTNPAPAFPFVETGAYTLLNADVTYRFPNNFELAIGARNLLDDHYELAWGFPQQGRSLYTKVRLAF